MKFNLDDGAAICSVDGCRHRMRAKRLCAAHYRAARENRDIRYARRDEHPRDRIARRTQLAEGPLDTPCWLWQGARAEGYGSSSFGPNWRDSRVLYVHRVSYEVFVGPIPEGLEIDHLCRERLCCNPEHLEPVTRAENTRRAIPHRNSADVRGEKHPGARLTEDDIRAIRASSEPVAALANAYGVSGSHIYAIKTGKAWRHTA